MIGSITNVGRRVSPNGQHKHLFNLLSDAEKHAFSEFLEPEQTPLWEYWDEFVNKSLMLGKSPITIKGVRDTVKFLIRHTGIVSVEMMNQPRVLDDQITRLQIEREFSLNTRKSYLKNLNGYFLWLYRNHYIDANNIARIERGRARRKEITPLKKCEIDRFLTHLNTRPHSCSLERSRNLLMADILRFSGIRPCELLGLTTASIYREKGQWVLAVPGRKQITRTRYYHCPSFIVDSFQRYMALRTQYHRWETSLFVSMSTYEGLTVSGLQNLFKKISRELGFRVNAYGFRRYVATTMSENRVDRGEMSYFLGHSRFSTTDLYIERSCHLTAKASSTMATLSVS